MLQNKKFAIREVVVQTITPFSFCLLFSGLKSLTNMYAPSHLLEIITHTCGEGTACSKMLIDSSEVWNLFMRCLQALYAGFLGPPLL